jgi:hypothetical protein
MAAITPAARARALAILVLLAASGMAGEADEGRKQRDAVAAITANGGSVAYENVVMTIGELAQRPAQPRSRGGQGEKSSSDVVWVDFVTDPAAEMIALPDRPADGGLGPLEALPKLRCLMLGQKQASDAALEHVGRLAGLESLILGDCGGLRDRGLAHIGKLTKLKTLMLAEADLRDENLRHLASLPALEDLAITGSRRLTDAALGHIAKIGTLKRLAVTGGGITDDGLARLRDLRDLEHLSISLPRFTPRGLENLKCLSKLEVLNVGVNGLTPEWEKKFRAAMPKLKRFVPR